MESGLVVSGPVNQDFMGLAMSSDYGDNGNKVMGEKRPPLERSESQAIPSTSAATGSGSSVSSEKDSQGKQINIYVLRREANILSLCWRSFEID